VKQAAHGRNSVDGIGVERSISYKKRGEREGEGKDFEMNMERSAVLRRDNSIATWGLVAAKTIFSHTKS
jgi:hypothetical protein